MPMFQFDCPECGLQFEELVDDKDKDVVACGSCGAEAEKSISSFGFQFDSGKVEDGTTGVDSVDNSIDKVVGRDSVRRWEEIKDRRHRKRRVARNRAGKEDAPVKKDPTTQEYDVMEDDEIVKNEYLHEQKEEFKRQVESADEDGDKAEE